MYGKTLFEQSLTLPPHIVDERRAKRDRLKAEVARLTLALTYCDDERVLADLLVAEEKYRRAR